jgi:hypothetical protein
VSHDVTFERAVEAMRDRFARAQTHLVTAAWHYARVRGLARCCQRLLTVRFARPEAENSRSRSRKASGMRALIERVFSEGAHAIDLSALPRIALRPLVAQLMELRNAANRSLTEDSDTCDQHVQRLRHVVERRTREFYAAKIIKRRQLPRATHSSPSPERLDAFLLKSDGAGR